MLTIAKPEVRQATIRVDTERTESFVRTVIYVPLWGCRLLGYSQIGHKRRWLLWQELLGSHGLELLCQIIVLPYLDDALLHV